MIITAVIVWFVIALLLVYALFKYDDDEKSAAINYTIAVLWPIAIAVFVVCFPFVFVAQIGKDHRRKKL